VTTITEARTLIAGAVSSAGVECSPYAPDSLIAPAAYVEGVDVDYTGTGWTFCGTGTAQARVVACAQRNDRAGGMQMLEDLAPGVMTALEAVDGVRVMSVGSGEADIGGQTLPAIMWTVQFVLGQ